YFSYGAVPITIEPLNLDNQDQPKSTAGEVLNQSLSDIDFAIANLSQTLYPDSGGHAVKTSAQALKLRVLMYEGYDQAGLPNVEILTQARDLALEIMNAGYELDPIFENVFRDASQEDSPEI